MSGESDFVAGFVAGHATLAQWIHERLEAEHLEWPDDAAVKADAKAAYVKRVREAIAEAFPVRPALPVSEAPAPVVSLTLDAMLAYCERAGLVGARVIEESALEGGRVVIGYQHGPDEVTAYSRFLRVKLEGVRVTQLRRLTSQPYWGIFTTEHPDRYGEVLVQAGMRPVETPIPIGIGIPVVAANVIASVEAQHIEKLDLRGLPAHAVRFHADPAIRFPGLVPIVTGKSTERLGSAITKWELHAIALVPYREAINHNCCLRPIDDAATVAPDVFALNYVATDGSQCSAARLSPDGKKLILTGASPAVLDELDRWFGQVLTVVVDDPSGFDTITHRRFVEGG